jgi:DNA 3'-phosphatase
VVSRPIRGPAGKLVLEDPAVSRAVKDALGGVSPRKAGWAKRAAALDAGLTAAVAPGGAGGAEIVVEEALALRRWASQMGDRALPYVVGRLALAGVRPHVLQAALSGEAIQSGRIHDSFRYDGSKKIKVAFFDADGTLRVAPSGKVTANEPEDVRILPFVADRLQRLAEEGYLICIVSNQAGVGAGYTTAAKADAALQHTAELIREQGGQVHYTDFAPSKEDDGYKPSRGMADRLLAAIKEKYGDDVEIDWDASFMVGDASSRKGETLRDGRVSHHHSDADKGFADRLGIRFEEPQDFFGWASFGKDGIDDSHELSDFWHAFTEKFANGENRLLAAQDASAIGAYKTFVSNLIRYHNADGKGNGSKLQGVQLAPGVNTPEDLKESVCKLSHALATQPFVYHLRQPFIEKRRQEFRRRIAEERAPSVALNTREAFHGLAERIQDPRIRGLVQRAIDAAPEEHFTEPSSSSGKHHPPDEINPGGLAMHVHRVLVVAEWLCDYYGVDRREKDLVLAGVILHDSQKGGRPWKGYAPDHGPIAADWLGKLWVGEDDASTQKIRELAHNHMAQWNAPKPTPPQDRLNQIVSYADYLASQDEIIIQTHPGEKQELEDAAQKIWAEIVADSAEKRVSFWQNKKSNTATVVFDVPAVLPARGCIKVPQATVSIFDLDDNILRLLDSRIYVYDKQSGRELAVPTEIYAEVRDRIGYDQRAPVAGEGLDLGRGDLTQIDLRAIDSSRIEWSRFHHRADDARTGSFRDFHDLADPELFVRQANAAIENPAALGPSFDSFVLMCSNPITAQFAHIVTARGHDPATIHAVLRDWQKRGIIKYVPPKENVITCSNPDVQRRLGFESPTSDIGEVKVRAIAAIMREIAKLEIGARARAIVSADGTTREQLHIIGFSDDDTGNNRAVHERICRAMQEDPAAFASLKLTTFATGGTRDGMSVLDGRGGLRAMRPEEINEAWFVVQNGPRAYS